jgi:Flp pilus assembly protein TadG
MKWRPLLRRLRDQKGATIVVVALVLVVLIGFAALAVDLAYLYVVRGELQNAADSGALAGAQVLYATAPLGVQVNPDANQTALDLVSANYSEQSTVSVKSIERGHWSFATRTFTPNNSLLAVSLWNVTSAQLDANPDFINAVRVITTRKIVAGTTMPEAPFFARIFGISGPAVEAVAVAYIGFAGTLEPWAVDAPIAICQQSIYEEGQGYTCNTGKMINSGGNLGTSNTAAWTNFEQPCQGAASASQVKNLIGTGPVCGGGGNPSTIALGVPMSSVGGQQTGPSLFTLRDCWNNITNRQKIWPLTLPVMTARGIIQLRAQHQSEPLRLTSYG